jgi:hypothetical protein
MQRYKLRSYPKILWVWFELWPLAQSRSQQPNVLVFSSLRENTVEGTVFEDSSFLGPQKPEASAGALRVHSAHYHHPLVLLLSSVNVELTESAGSMNDRASARSRDGGNRFGGRVRKRNNKCSLFGWRKSLLSSRQLRASSSLRRSLVNPTHPLLSDAYSPLYE